MRTAVVVFVLGCATLAAAAEPKAIRLATLAPETSGWHRLARDFATEVRARSPLQIDLLANGVAGNERDFVDKLRAGVLDGAVLSTAGLGMMQPKLRVLDLPLLFRSDAEVDAVRATLAGELDALFEAAGLVRIAWADVGAQHLLTRDRPGFDLAGVTHWKWDDDPIGDTFLAALRSPGRAAAVPDMLPLVMKGEIAALLSPPLTTLAMQLHRGLRFISATPIDYEIGAVVVRKAVWDALRPATQQVLRECGRTFERRLLAFTRENNAKAMRYLVAAGVQQRDLPAVTLRDAARATAEALDDKLYSKQWRLRVQRAAEAARKP